MSTFAEQIPYMGWVAALVDPSRAEAVFNPARSVDGQALISLLRKHKVPLLSLAGGPLAGRLEELTPAWGQALAEERREFAAQRAEFATVQAALDAAQVAGMLIKAVGIPPSLPYRSDNLDLLVHPEDAQRARRALEGLGYVELRNVEEPAKFLFRRFVAGRSVGAVHLHECVGWGTGFMDEEGLWWRARPAPDDPTLTIPGPTDALLITIAHASMRTSALPLATCSACCGACAARRSIGTWLGRSRSDVAGILVWSRRQRSWRRRRRRSTGSTPGLRA